MCRVVVSLSGENVARTRQPRADVQPCIHARGCNLASKRYVFFSNDPVLVTNQNPWPLDVGGGQTGSASS